MSYLLIRKKKILFIGALLFILLLAFFVLNTYNHMVLSPIEVLKSLPYVTWTSAENNIQKSGVTKYDPKRSFRGINVYSSANLSAASLIDMTGKQLHTWSEGTYDKKWHHVEMCKNGDLLVIVKDKVLMKLDWNSNVKWIKEMRFHHDIAVDNNGDIYTFIRDTKEILYLNRRIPILNDYIVIFSADGEVKDSISIFDLFGSKIPSERLNKIIGQLGKLDRQKRKGETIVLTNDTIFDVFHSNTVEIIDRDIDGFCKKGTLLVCIRELNLIAVIDKEKKKILWSWGSDELVRPHSPTLSENGNILIFDNGDRHRRKYSRIVELNPLTKRIVWEYKSNPPGQFFSVSRGSAQKLPNANTLITDSHKGRVFELTYDGEVVWEFYNPQIKIKKNRKMRATIYPMIRITDPENYPCLKSLK